MRSYYRIIAISLGFFLCLSSYARTVSPLQYGLKNATNGIERYEVLLKCHQDALKKGYDISYRKIDTVKVEIPTTLLLFL